MTTTMVDVFSMPVRPESKYVKDLLELLKYEYIGLYGEPDPNPEGGLERAHGFNGQVHVLLTPAYEPLALCGIVLENGDAVLKRVFVRWEVRGQGLSKTLMALAENSARSLGAKRLVLETGIQQTIAIALYASLGYTKVDPFGYYAGQATSVFLGKEL